MKKKIFAGIFALAAVLALVCIIFAQGGSDAYVPAADEIALRIQFDTKEDVGLLVYDYRAEDRDYSGGISLSLWADLYHHHHRRQGKWLPSCAPSVIRWPILKTHGRG